MKPYTIGLYEKAMPPALSWEEKLRFAKSAGYDFVEISIDEKDEKLMDKGMYYGSFNVIYKGMNQQMKIELLNNKNKQNSNIQITVFIYSFH